MTKLLPINTIQNYIYTMRNTQVMLDRDLAKFYGVKTKVLNQAVKRNIRRFPKKFRFQLTNEEKNQLVTNCDRLEPIKYSSVNPHAFTEQGVSMLSAVLKSSTAIEISIKIINSFVQMRKFLSLNAQVFNRLEKIEYWKKTSDEKFDKLFLALESGNLKPNHGIFYNGQVFDAHIFISNIIKDAKKSIILIDNFINESVLELFSKKENGVRVTIYSKNITKITKLDIKKFNKQYGGLEIKKFKDSHDRFLIIDDTELYHLGASLKDLGKKWFAFSRMDSFVEAVLAKLAINN